MQRIIGVVLVALVATTATSSLAAQETRRGKDALGGWKDDRPGVRRHITVKDLPPVGEEKQSYAQVVARPPGSAPKVPAGFTATLVASGFNLPRVLRTAPNGDLFLAETGGGRVRVLRMRAGDSVPERNEVFTNGLLSPYGIAFHPLGPNPQWVYVADTTGVVRFPYSNGDLVATGKAERVITGIPSVHHWTHDIAFTADGSRLLLDIGSGSNVALDMFPEPITAGGLERWKQNHPLGAPWDTERRRAQLLSFTPGGTEERTVATGLRNCTGLTIQPATGLPWCVVNERDGLGNDTPFEYATMVKEGAFYGWPWFYIGNHQDPRHKDARADLRDRITVPDVLLQAHSAPMQIVFYEEGSFPAAYKGSAFVTMHGSWNRVPRTGYKVVRLLFDAQGKPTGEYEDFMTGFVIDDARVWGRPVGVTVGQDGSLFVSEDGNGTIWRVRYAAGRPR